MKTSFTSEGKVKVCDKNGECVEEELPNTIGEAKCSKPDQSKCELVGIGMSDNGSFQGNYDLPAGLTQGSDTLAELDTKNK